MAARPKAGKNGTARAKPPKTGKKTTIRARKREDAPERGKRLRCDVVVPLGGDCTKGGKAGKNVGATRRVDGKPCQAWTDCDTSTAARSKSGKAAKSRKASPAKRTTARKKR